MQKEAIHRPRSRDRLQQELEEAQHVAEDIFDILDQARPRGQQRRRGVQEALALLMRRTPGTATSCQLWAARRPPPEEAEEAEKVLVVVEAEAAPLTWTEGLSLR